MKQNGSAKELDNVLQFSQNISANGPVPNKNRKQKGSNWINPHIGLTINEDGEYSAVASNQIYKGAPLVVYGGKIITREDFAGLSDYMQNFPYQITEDLFISPTDENDIGVGESLNHSCDPNSGFASEIKLVAIRSIAKGEEITIDYATCISSNHDAFDMDCWCSAKNCRRKITGSDWQIPELQNSLFDYFQPYLKEKILFFKKHNEVISQTAILSNGSTALALKEQV